MTHRHPDDFDLVPVIRASLLRDLDRDDTLGVRRNLLERAGMASLR